jgi:hypothetical protein
MAGVSGQNISDDRMLEATGRTREAWHELLDAEGATGWKHPQIASWLRDEHGVDGWWAQGITVGYEQARGMRLPGQLADGTFTTSSSKTVGLPQPAALELVIAAYSESSGREPSSVSPEAKHPTARWKLDDGSQVLATVSPVGEKSRVSLTRLKLTSPDQLEPAKDALAVVLGVVASRADNSVG